MSKHRGFDPGEDTDVWCPQSERLERVKNDVCQGCMKHLPQPGELTLAEEMARMNTPLYQEIQNYEDDWLIDSGDYGYGGEWFPRKALDADAIYQFVEQKLADQREQIAKGIERERDHPGRGWNDYNPDDVSLTSHSILTGMKEGFTAAVNVVRARTHDA